MLQDRRVVVVIPSGRERYMRVLLPYLVNNDEVDQIQLWQNTDEQSDIAFFESMAKTYPKVAVLQAGGELTKSLYDASRNHYQYSDGIYRYYPVCVDPNTIYVKMDDDICWVHPDFFSNLVKGVIDHEHTNYACLANVFNVPHTTKIHQDKDVLDDTLGHCTGDPRCPYACTNGPFAAHLHEQFLALLATNETEKLYFQSQEIKGRARIGVLAWTGENFAAFGGAVGPYDEKELTVRIPTMLGKPLWMIGDALVSHYAFSHQRAHLEDNTNILAEYARIAGNV